jgi:hypothetical protein
MTRIRNQVVVSIPSTKNMTFPKMGVFAYRSVFLRNESMIDFILALILGFKKSCCSKYNVAQIYCIDKTINAINLEFKTVNMTEK